MAVPNEGTTSAPSDANGVRIHGLWDGTNFRAWRGSTSGVGKILIANASGTEITIADDAAFTAGTSPVLPIGAVYQATPDEVNDGDVGAPRMTIRRAVLNAADFSMLNLSESTPTPSGTDITTDVGGALSSAFFAIRNTSAYSIMIPMGTAGWRKLALQISVTSAFDQTAGVTVRATAIPTVNLGATLLAFSLAQSVHRFTIGDAATGGGAGSSTSASNVHYNVPALSCGFAYVVVQFLFSVAPTTGTYTLSVMRST